MGPEELHERYLGLVSRRMDGEATLAEDAELERHLGGCESCRAAATAWAEQAEGLELLLARDRGEPASLAAAAMAALHARPARPARWRRVLGLGAAALAGAAASLAAVTWLAPRPPPPRELPVGPAVVLSLVGPAEVVQAPGAGPVALDTGVRLGMGAVVRTGAEGRLVLSLADGTELRLNEATELALEGPRAQRLLLGEVYARVAPDPRPLVIATAHGEARALGTALDLEATAEDTRLITVRGVVELVDLAGGRVRVEARQQATIALGRVGAPVDLAYVGDATRWMLDLLRARGDSDPELRERVDELLAHLGETKLSYLAERDILDLGPSCALPLARYLEREGPTASRTQRRKAARLLEDIATPACRSTLEALTRDADEAVRDSAHRALGRLGAGGGE
ncbi:MAG: FecR domain-containing protein [Planctomycetes bacterium]|nr:FecR domain-containing protein [Planctomycetota bacterium]